MSAGIAWAVHISCAIA